MITKDMTMQDIVDTYPEVIPILLEYGLGCIGCGLSSVETLEEGVMVHGLDIDELNNILKDCNEVISEEAPLVDSNK